jgi:hypothetical protein
VHERTKRSVLELEALVLRKEGIHVHRAREARLPGARGGPRAAELCSGAH